MKKIYIICDKVSDNFCGQPFICNTDDEANRWFHIAAKSSPFRRDMQLRCICELDIHKLGFVSDFSEIYAEDYDFKPSLEVNREEQA